MRVGRLALALALVAGAIGCSDAVAPVAVGPPGDTRAYRLGFSAAPPRHAPDLAYQTVQLWSPRADIALIPVPVPWEALLDGEAPEDLVIRDYAAITEVYGALGFPLVVLLEPADPVVRYREAADLIRMGRTIEDPLVQDAYRRYVLALDSILAPEYIGFASEVNLIRAVAPRGLYRALREISSTTAEALRDRQSRAQLFVSAQVETAWGLLPGTGRFEGIDRLLDDFPSIDALGLSTYPYLGGFKTPEDVPLNYFSRLMPDGRLPLLVVEGGWPSKSIPELSSTEGTQARWILREMAIAAQAGVVAVMQIPFTDLDPADYGEDPVIHSYFGHIGLVDTEFLPKEALVEWDRIFGRELIQPAFAPRTPLSP